MYLEKEAVDYFRKFDFSLNRHLRFIGDNSSRKLGRNMEFEQYNQYHPGDDVKDIDWKVFARTDKIFVKNYGSDLNAKTRIVMDVSGSMEYAGKLEETKRICAILYKTLADQGCAVSLSTISERLTDCGRLMLTNLEDILGSVRAYGKTDMDQLSGLPDDEIVFLISDFWTENTDWSLFRRKRINALHILSVDELELAVAGNLRLVDAETAEMMNCVPSEIRAEYKKRLAERIERMRRELFENGNNCGVFPMSTRYYINLKQFLEQFKSLHRYGGRR